MDETTLIVARHGNTFNKGDVILRIGAQTDLPLTDEGRAQGRRLGERLAERGLIPTTIYSAPLCRTLETANEMANELCLEPEPIVEKFLTELDYGEDDGRPETEVARRLGALEAENADETPPEELEKIGVAALKRWDKEQILPKGWAFLQKRVDELGENWRTFAQKIVRQEPGDVVFAATSNGIARFSIEILPPSEPRPTDLKLATGAFAVFIWDGENWRLDAWNVR